jgi:hypothetical protein
LHCKQTHLICNATGQSCEWLRKNHPVTHERRRPGTPYRQYFSLTGLTYTDAAALGTINVNYSETTQAFDARGRMNMVVSSTGTINRTVYDGLDRVVSEWVGIVVL